MHIEDDGAGHMGPLHNHYPVPGPAELAVFVADPGPRRVFAEALLPAIAAADPGQRERLAHVFPLEVGVWERWHALADPRCCDVAVMVRDTARALMRAAIDAPVPGPRAAAS